jgi:hypothetical protein
MRLHLRRASADHMHAEEGEPQPFSLPEPTYAGAAASHVGSFFARFLVHGAIVHTVHRIHRHSTSRVGAQILALRSTLTPSNTLPQRTQRMGRPGLQSRLRARSSRCVRCRVRRARYLFNAADPPPCDWFGYINHAHASARATMRVELLLAFLTISSRIASCACSAFSCRRRPQSPPFPARTTPLAHTGRAACSAKQKPLYKGLLSGRRDSNSGPLVPQTSALTRLRHAPRHRARYQGALAAVQAWVGRLRKQKPRRTEQRANLTLVRCKVWPRDGDADRLVRAQAAAAAGQLRRELCSPPADVGARAREVRERRVG